MPLADKSLNNLGYFVLLYLPLAGVAFFLTYFSVIGGESFFTHLHFAVMSLWLGLSITQPMLIRYKRFSQHRVVGRLSFVVLPMVVITGYVMLRKGALRELTLLQDQVASGAASFTNQEMLNKVADFALLGSPYIFLPAIFYLLAMVNRRNMIFHSRYMLAAILTVTGPIVDRVFFIALGMMRVGPLPAESISFILVDGILLALLVADYRSGRPIKSLVVSLSIYLIAQAGYFILDKSAVWYVVAPVWLQIE